MPEQFQQTFSSIEVKVERGKKDLEMEHNQDQFGEHWKKQHAKQVKPAPTALGASEITTSPEQSSSLFIPIPFWNRQTPGRPFTVEDPEWKEFAMLQADRKRQSGLQDRIHKGMLQTFVREESHEHLAILKVVLEQGAIQRMSYLTIIPPMKALPVYQNLGLIVGAKGMHWHWRTLPGGVGDKLDDMRRPKAFAHAYWVSAQIFLQASWRAIKSTLDGKSSRTSDASLAQSEKETDVKLEPNGQATMTSLVDGKSGLLAQAESMQRMHKELVARVTPVQAFQQARRAFLKTWASDSLAELRRNRPPETCLIRCSMDLIGRIATIRTEVFAIYIPARDVLVGPVVIERTTVIPNPTEWNKKATQKGAQKWKATLRQTTDEENQRLLMKHEQALKKASAELAQDWKILQEKKKKLEEKMRRSGAMKKALEEGDGAKDRLQGRPNDAESAAQAQKFKLETAGKVGSLSTLSASENEIRQLSAEGQTRSPEVPETAVDIGQPMSSKKTADKEHGIDVTEADPHAAKDPEKYVQALSGKHSSPKKDDKRE